MSTIHNVLHEFCSLSCQTPNLTSLLFSLARMYLTLSKHKSRTSSLSLTSVLTLCTLLTLLFFSNSDDRNKDYEFILNKFRAKLMTVKANKLNHAGRLIYIKSVLASIPVYYMSTVLLSKTFVGKITAIIRRFWWSRVQEDNPTSPIAFRS